MFSKTARYYDEIYSFKNYADESRKIQDLIYRECPRARSILDVACGTAEHAKYLAEQFAIDGIDLEAEFVDIARRKLPSGVFSVADMRDFNCGKAFDVVQCLFSSIGYLRSLDEIVRSLQCFKRHLNPGGVILVEPWITPEAWRDRAGNMVTVDKDDLKICRMNAPRLSGNFSILEFHYLIGTAGNVEHIEENHELRLTSVAEFLECFREAGLAVTHDPKGIFGRGIYVGRVN